MIKWTLLHHDHETSPTKDDLLVSNLLLAHSKAHERSTSCATCDIKPRTASLGSVFNQSRSHSPHCRFAGPGGTRVRNEVTLLEVRWLGLPARRAGTR